MDIPLSKAIKDLVGGKHTYWIRLSCH